MLKNLVVETTHLEKNHYFVIHNIADKDVNTPKFNDRDGKSVNQYHPILFSKAQYALDELRITVHYRKEGHERKTMVKTKQLVKKWKKLFKFSKFFSIFTTRSKCCHSKWSRIWSVGSNPEAADTFCTRQSLLQCFWTPPVFKNYTEPTHLFLDSSHF